jgi:glycosyltransferase involved in cell wall biosynthesis
MALKVGVFHPGTQHSWQTALAFQEDRQLAWYATSIFYDPSRWPYRLEALVPARLGARLHREFSRRHLPALAPAQVRQFGLWEWIETGARRAGRERIADWANNRGNQRFGHAVARLVEREPVDVLWGYNTSSLEAFRWAKRRGIRCILDQTIGHCASLNRVMLAEQARNPEFFLGSYVPMSAEAVERQNEELELADLVVVGSEFCAGTLVENGCEPSKIRIVPYGFDETLFPSTAPKRHRKEGQPVRFLFVGLVHPRKGIAPLLQAFEQISMDTAKLTLVGQLAIPPATFQRYKQRTEHLGSLPRPEVVKHFLAADCFIFPSLFEGSAIVLHEATAAGLGIVQSASAGNGVADGKNGIVLPEVTPEAIKMAVSSILKDPEQLARWQEAAWQMRPEHTWQRYRDRVRKIAST